MVDVKDTHVTLFSNNFANNVFCNQLLLHINTWYWTIDYLFVLDTKYSNSENCFND